VRRLRLTRNGAEADTKRAAQRVGRAKIATTFYDDAWHAVRKRSITTLSTSSPIAAKQSRTAARRREACGTTPLEA
jgi:hypothetical protein